MMEIGRRASRIASTDDSAFAGAVGAVLMLALMVTVYVEISRTEVPRWGADAERVWSGEVQASMVELAAAAASGVGSDTPVTGSLALSSDPQGIDIPILGGLKPHLPAGSVAFDSSCASFDASHSGSAGSILDLEDAARGCLVFSADTVYASPFVYQIELGGVLRVQGDQAVVISGPPLDLNTSSPTAYRVSLGVATMRGSALTTSSAGSARVDLVPGATALAPSAQPNAGSAAWGIDTRYPEAWSQWLRRAFESAGFDADEFSVSCAPSLASGCVTGAGGLGRVEIVIDGPGSAADDIVLSISHGVYDVSLR